MKKNAKFTVLIYCLVSFFSIFIHTTFNNINNINYLYYTNSKFNLSKSIISIIRENTNQCTANAINLNTQLKHSLEKTIFYKLQKQELDKLSKIQNNFIENKNLSIFKFKISNSLLYLKYAYPIKLKFNVNLNLNNFTHLIKYSYSNYKSFFLTKINATQRWFVHKFHSPPLI